jgi:NAD(P)-dependent dehydrogenase (short-subunit alcohol dehydrogenase family)
MSTAIQPQVTEDPRELFDLTGRSALITGASGALGQAVARGLAGAGAHVTLAAGNAEALKRLEDEIGGAGGQVATIARRPESTDDADAMVAAAVESAGRLDIVVPASGVNIVAPIVDMDEGDWTTVMDANVRGSWLVCKAAGRRMIEQGEGGRVVLVSSARGKLGHPAGYSAYCPSKAAVDGLTRTLAWEWGGHGITVNAIGPTVFRSDLTAWMFGDDERAVTVRGNFMQRLPLGRLGEPEDFVGAVVFLASRASAFVTGQVLYVDGGYTSG